MSSRKATEKPRRLWIFWPVMVLLLAAIMGLTMVKDFHLTGDQLNVLFYILVPPVSMLGGALAGSGAARAFKQAVKFVDVLALIVYVGELLSGLLFIAVTGVTTPGS